VGLELGLGSAGLRSEEGRRRAERGLGFQPTLASGCCELIFRYQSEPLWKYRQVGPKCYSMDRNQIHHLHTETLSRIFF
jgi:hypothetical protein